MPKDKDLKRLVRARVARTGERYTTARAALVGPLGDPRHRRLINELGTVDTLQRAYEQLKALPQAILRPLAVGGSTHHNWRVRRGCCRLLDDLAFTEDSYAALSRCLDDPEPRVRRAALHSLSCEHCKPEGCTIDQRSAIERGLRDSNRRVREVAVGSLTWGPRPQPWALELLRGIAVDDPSAKLRALARNALDRVELMDRTDRQRQRLPLEILHKTQRHAGRWIAMHEGRVVEVSRSNLALNRAMKRRGLHDAAIYWVGEPS